MDHGSAAGTQARVELAAQLSHNAPADPVEVALDVALDGLDLVVEGRVELVSERTEHVEHAAEHQHDLHEQQVS